jgi:membrane protease YdiL (CAAX protease family)
MTTTERVGLRWGLPDVLVAWIIAIVGVVVVTIPFGEDAADDVTALIVGLAAQNGLILAWLAFVSARKGSGSLRRDYGFTVRARDGLWLLVGVGLQIATSIATLPLRVLLGPDEPVQDVVESFSDASGVERILFALGVVALGPAVEELLFRGALLRSLARRTTIGWAVFGSAFIFAVVHPLLDPSLGTLAVTPALLAFGLVAGYRAVVTGSLSQPILLHVGFNLLTVLFLGFD